MDKNFSEKLDKWRANNDIVEDIVKAYKEACPEISDYIKTRVEQLVILKRSNDAIS